MGIKIGRHITIKRVGAVIVVLVISTLIATRLHYKRKETAVVTLVDTSGIVNGKTIRQWIQDLQRPEEKIRKKAFFTLSELTAKYALPEFIQEATEPWSKAFLQSFLDSSKIPNISQSIYDEIISVFIKATESSDEYMVSAFVYALGNARARTAIPVLAGLLKTSVGLHVAARALGKIGQDAASAVPNLLEVIHRQGPRGPRYEYEAVEATIEALGDICDTRALSALLELSNDDDEDIRWRAVDALGKILTKNQESIASPYIDALLKNLRDNSGRRVARTFAAYALSKIGPKAKVAVPDLIAMLKDENEDHRKAAVKALVRIAPDEEEVRSILMTLKDDPSSDVRAAVKEILP